VSRPACKSAADGAMNADISAIANIRRIEIRFRNLGIEFAHCFEIALSHKLRRLPQMSPLVPKRALLIALPKLRVASPPGNGYRSSSIWHTPQSDFR